MYWLLEIDNEHYRQEETGGDAEITSGVLYTKAVTTRDWQRPLETVRNRMWELETDTDLSRLVETAKDY